MIFRRSWIVSGMALSLFAGSVDASANWPWSSPATGAWNSTNSPNRLEQGFIADFDRLPLSATVPIQRKPYVDTYWPSNRGGIAYRWNSKDPAFAWQDPHIVVSPQTFKYHSPTLAEARRMSADELAQLSPTEKYDLVRGEYEYPLTHRILGDRRHFNPWRTYWEGICHGWAPASVNHSEPMPVTVMNPQGILVPFGSADVKAILDYYYATVNMTARQMGKRCRTELKPNSGRSSPDCDDINAGAFHIVLANYIALRETPFVADVSRGIEVWNNAIYWYDSKITDTTGPTRNSASGTVKRLRMETTVRFPSDDERLAPQWNPTVNQDELEIPEDDAQFDPADYENKYRFEAAKYEYWLDLDSAGKIIGGDWISSEHPDYIWMKSKMEFTGAFSTLKRIYKPMFE